MVSTYVKRTFFSTILVASLGHITDHVNCGLTFFAPGLWFLLHPRKQQSRIAINFDPFQFLQLFIRHGGPGYPTGKSLEEHCTPPPLLSPGTLMATRLTQSYTHDSRVPSNFTPNAKDTVKFSQGSPRFFRTSLRILAKNL